MKAGGLHNAVKIAHFAEAMDVQCLMGCMLESKVGVTAAACLAAGKKIITRTDLDAAVLLADDPVVGGVSFIGNRLHVSQAPGLGITGITGWQQVQ
jgi:L-alanine-DL-glutamate epimerase-like enolase superfamily enzyme